MKNVRAAWFTAALAVLGCVADDPPERAVSVVTRPPEAEELLRAQTVVVRSLESDERHVYRLPLTAGEFLQLEVEQNRLDVVLEVEPPEGEEPFAIDTPNGDSGTEQLFLVATRAGEYRLTLRLCAAPIAGGTYRLQIVSQRPATAADRRHADAELAFARAKSADEAAPATLASAALEGYTRAAELWERFKPRRHADALHALGRMELKAGRRREAQALLRQVVALRERNGQPSERALALADLGQAHQNTSSPREAERCFNKAAELFHHTGEAQQEGLVRMNLGHLLTSRGRFTEALSELEAARMLIGETARPTVRISLLNQIGELYSALGKSGLALDHHRLALWLLRGTSEPDLRAETFVAAGNTYLANDELDEAERAYAAAVRLRVELTRPVTIAIAKTGLGLVAERRHQTALAWSSFLEAQDIFRREEDQLSAAVTANDLGWLATKLGRFGEALAYHQQALSVAHQLEDPLLKAAAFSGAARAERGRGHRGAARAAAQQAVEVTERTLAANRSSSLGGHFLATQQDVFALLIELLMEEHARQPRRGWDALALGVSERSRARGLLATLGEDRSRFAEGLSAEELGRLRALGEQIQQQSDRCQPLHEEDPAWTACKAEQATSSAAYHALEERLRRQSPWLISAARPAPLALAAIRRDLLDDETALLEFHLGKEKSFLWLATKRELRSFELKGREEIELLAQALRTRLAGNPLLNGGSAAVAAAELASLLLAPAAPLPPVKRLLFVADGALSAVPFAVLPEPAGEARGGGRLLIEAYEIATLPSASILGAMRQRARARARPTAFMAIVSRPVYNANDPRLAERNTTREDAALRHGDVGCDTHQLPALLDGETAQAFTGFEANRQLILSGSLRGFRMLHFHLHAELHHEQPDLSALLLSAYDPRGQRIEGRLTQQEIVRLDLPADLVTLAACRTGLGPEVPGEGRESLARAFLLAGADRVLLSLWDLANDSTCELVERFYRAHFKDGLAPAAALRKAQLTMLREPSWAAPTHWAGVQLVGDFR